MDCKEAQIEGKTFHLLNAAQTPEDNGSEKCIDFQGRLGVGCGSLLAKTMQNLEAFMLNMFDHFLG